MAIVDRFADIRVLRYYVPNFETLSLQQKLLLYYLSEAALWGRDILWQQNCSDNLRVRRLFECLYKYHKSSGTLDSRLEEYTKRLWTANGIHHHYSNDKFTPKFTIEDLQKWAESVPADVFIAKVHQSVSDAIENVRYVVFDEKYKAKKVCLDNDTDLVTTSAVNFYSGVTQAEVEHFYASKEAKNALNSTLEKLDKDIVEVVWRLNGRYSAAIEKIIYWLRKAQSVSENPTQANIIGALVKYYETGDLTDFDEFNKLWVKEKSTIDFINGFIEVYNDPLGLKASWESIVELVDIEASERIRLISENAQWFEDHSPIAPQHRKRDVCGVSMNVVSAVMLGGDCYPATPIGVNLPNADWIREQFGSKSISLNNITRAYDEEANGSGVLQEFAASPAEIERYMKFGSLSDELHTQLHECLGHGSGQMEAGYTLDDLKAYGSTIEEARADLFALYFMADDKMQEIGVAPSKEVAWTHYDAYLRSGLLVQMSRIDLGKNIEESHMRNRQLIAKWVLERAQPQGYAAMVERDGKHYVEIYNYEALRQLFGDLLHEVQRIKSTGDYAAARDLVEKYGVRLDVKLHTEVRARYEALGVAPFSVFVNPRLELVTNNGTVVDVKISYNENFDEQMLRYSREYASLM